MFCGYKFVHKSTYKPRALNLIFTTYEHTWAKLPVDASYDEMVMGAI